LTYFFDEYSLDSDRRELRRGCDIVPVEPQVFDLLQFLIRNRERVVSKDDLIAAVWNRRIVSDSTLSSRITAARHAVGDSGERQRLIRTIARRGFRFVATVREQPVSEKEPPVNGLPGPAAENPPARSTRTSPAERRQLTIMVCRVVETAMLSARIDPEDLGEIIHKYYGSIREVVERYDGYIAKYTDDGVVAYFGYPSAHEDDAERAVRAGLALTRWIGQPDIENLVEPFRARVGIATGLVLVGNSPGADPTAENAVIGEVPYLAARLQDRADAGTVVIAASTRRLVGNLFEYGALQTSGSSGIDDSTSAWLVLGESTITSRFEALRPPRDLLIGREEELKLLLRRWGDAKSGEGRAVLIWGEPGIGKSHLVAAFQDTIVAEPHTCRRYFCSPHRTQTALFPVISQIEHAAGFSSGDTGATKLDKLERLFGLSSRELDSDIVSFAELLSVPTAGRYSPLSLSAQRRREMLLESLVRQLLSLAASQPVLVVLEDAHWIDPTTRELFDIIVDRARDLPLLVIITYRPEFSAPWLGQSHVTAMTLNRLGRRDNAALIKQVAGGKDLPPVLLEQIVTRTDGVPLFIEEVTKSILESGMLRAEGSAYFLEGPLPTVAVPPSLQASLVARLDRIASARGVVQTGSALGREFRYALVRAVSSLADAELEAMLELLVTSGLVHKRGEARHAVYAFKHALVRDAAYETMPRSQRSMIHRRIVAVIEEQFPEIATHQPDVLAYHCTEAGLAEEAIDFWIKAARIALDRSAGVEAQGQVEKAMSLIPRVAAGTHRRQLEGRLQVALGDALAMTAGFASPQVMAALTKARDLLDENIHPLEALGALCGLFNYHLIRSESPLCLKLVEPRLRGDLDRPTATVVHYLIGTAHLHLGNFRQSIRALQEALALYDEDNCRPVSFIAGYHLRSFILIWLGLGHLYVGSLKLAAETISAAVTDARSRSHPFTLVSALLALARFRNHTHDLQGAIAATEEGMAIATEQRSPYHVSRASVLRAVNVVESGRPEEGIVLMERALAGHRATGANFQSSYNLSCLAEAHARAGKHARAAALASEALAEVSRTGERWWEAEALRIKGEILTDAKSGNEAEACLGNALECARRQDAKLWELNAALSLASLWSSKGDAEGARELLTPIYHAFVDGYQTDALSAARRLLNDLDTTIATRSTSSRRTGTRPLETTESSHGGKRARSRKSPPSRK
jgi:DNA-binding winged helix-turn-helix (wHTH) protein/tetratricopeptide (TPR) repeat protein